jgi:hypothetical protein
MHQAGEDLRIRLDRFKALNVFHSSMPETSALNAVMVFSGGMESYRDFNLAPIPAALALTSGTSAIMSLAPLG